MHSKIVVAQQFRGPPNSGNGGYVCGLMASRITGPATAMLRAPPPLDTPLDLACEDGVVRILDADGTLVGEARAGDAAALPSPPPAPSFAAATSSRRSIR